MSSRCYRPAAGLHFLVSMKALLILVLSCLPALAHAQSPGDKRASSRWKDPELAFGAAFLVGGYATSVLWSRESDGDQDVLYVPVLGPWLELFSLPDCRDDDMFCDHGAPTRSVLLVSGIAQLVGTGVVIHALAKDDPREEPVLITPSFSGGGPGVTIRGKF